MAEESILNKLSPIEWKILPFITEKTIERICEKSKVDKTTALRALEYLSNKNIVKLETKTEKIIALAKNGIEYKKTGLPERKMINFLSKNSPISLNEKILGLSGEEFKAALGVLKKKALINIENNKIFLNAKKDEIEKKFLEEQFIEKLPLSQSKLEDQDRFALEQLKNRKEIIVIEDKKQIIVTPTQLGLRLYSAKKPENQIELLTPEIIKSKSWKEKEFRSYDVSSPVPKIFGGKRHFVNQSIDYARKIWTEMGFEEMSGNIINTCFWNFDALFVAQDHPVREMQDTYFVKLKGKLPKKDIVDRVKKAHELGVNGSKGWAYNFSEEESKKVVMRTHTTVISAQTLAKIKKSDLPCKFFAIGKCFRNEALDWKHSFEFNQTEGIVVDPNANLTHLLGYLKEFYNKMGLKKIRFRPSFFPYTEPSLEIDAYIKEKKQWVEIGGAGIFRPEVTEPLLGEQIPVLAWGPGFDRILMEYYQIKDIRDLYSNNLTKLREIKFWNKI